MSRKQWLRTCINLYQLSVTATSPAARDAFRQQYVRTKEKGEPLQR